MAQNTPDRDELDTIPAELRTLHHQLQADSAAWNRHAPSPERLITRYQTLLTQRMADSARAPIGNDASLRPPLRSERGYMNTTQKRLGGIFAAIIVAALLAATIVLFQHHPGKNNAAATPTLAPTATQAPALHVTTSQGWVYPSAINFGKSIAFAPNAPLTGYVCGNMSTQADAPIRFSVTHDGGATWHELAVTSAKGTYCNFSIDPINANDLVLFSFAHDGAINAYRSRDGGQTWSLLLVPAGDSAAVDLNAAHWAGSTLFMDVAQSGAKPADLSLNLAHTLAISINGGALTWVDTSQIYSSTDPHFTYALSSGFAIGTTFYAYLAKTPTPCPDPKPYTSCPEVGAPTLIKTSDNGATWTPYTPSSRVAHIFGTLADGHTLTGQLFDAKGGINGDYFISTDVGQSWTQLPSLPQPAHGSYGYGSGPSASDGTIYATYQQGSLPDSLIKLSPGATSWTTVAATIPGLSGSDSPTVSVDGAGHPNAVWSNLTSDGPQKPGIAYHAP